MNSIRQRIGISLLSGIGISLALALLSGLAIRWFPYRDKPMIPRPFFLYALLPGLTLGESFSGWARSVVFYAANSVAYALLVFCTVAIVGFVRCAEHDGSQ